MASTAAYNILNQYLPPELTSFVMRYAYLSHQPSEINRLVCLIKELERVQNHTDPVQIGFKLYPGPFEPSCAMRRL